MRVLIPKMWLLLYTPLDLLCPALVDHIKEVGLKDQPSILDNLKIQKETHINQSED